jgi:hypothetical protein
VSPAPVLVYGLSGVLTEISAAADHPLVVVLSFSIALVYTLFVGLAVVTALRSGDDSRRAAAIEVLKILTGFKVSAPRGEALPKAGKRKQAKRP